MDTISLLFILLLFFASLPVILKSVFSKNKHYKLFFFFWNILFILMLFIIASIFVSSKDFSGILDLAVNFSFYLYAAALWISPVGFKGVNILLNRFFSAAIVILSFLTILTDFFNESDVGNFFGAILILINIMIVFGTIYLLPLSLYFKIKEKLIGYI